MRRRRVTGGTMTMEKLPLMERSVGDGRAHGMGVTLSSQLALDGRTETAEPPFLVDPRHRARVVSRRAFSRGDAVWPLCGRLTTQSERTIQVGPSAHLEDDGGLAFLQHSCQPNVVVETSTPLMVFALHDIAAGQELTIFYPSTEWDMAGPFACRCGAPECIRFVAGARYLPVDVLGRYFVNAHVRRLLTAAVSHSWRPVSDWR
jgi:SET domain-containing protein